MNHLKTRINLKSNAYKTKKTIYKNNRKGYNYFNMIKKTDTKDSILYIGFQVFLSKKEQDSRTSLLARVLITFRRCLDFLCGSNQKTWKAFDSAFGKRNFDVPVPDHNSLQELRKNYLELCLNDPLAKSIDKLLFYINIATWVREKTEENTPVSDILRVLNDPNSNKYLPINNKEAPNFTETEANIVFDKCINFTNQNTQLRQSFMSLSNKLRHFEESPLLAWKVLWCGPTSLLTAEIQTCADASKVFFEKHEELIPSKEPAPDQVN